MPIAAVDRGHGPRFLELPALHGSANVSAMVGLALSAWIAVVAMDLSGETDCPSRDDVARELARLAPVAPAAGETDAPKTSAEIQRGPGGLSITLRGPDGDLLARRTVAISGSCAELATAAAVVITAWQGDLRPDLGPGLPEVPIAPQPGPAPTVIRRADVAAAASARPFEVGAAFLGSAVGRDLAPGLQVDAQAGRSGSGLGLRIAATVVGAHAIAVGAPPGQSQWSRVGLGLGVRDRFWLGDLAIDARLGAVAGVVRVEGTGFNQNYTTYGFDPGLDAGIRVGPGTGRLAPFLEIGAAAWSGKSAVVLAGMAAERTIPRFELGAAAGIRFGRFR
jgi:hypothetical protein